MTPIELTREELALIRNALNAFMADFGHHEHDVVQQVRDLLGKMQAATT
jgi:hypothetical protein